MGTEKVLTAVIIGSAPGTGAECLLRYLTGEELVICADGGLKLAERIGLKPDWYVGDSDSGGHPPEGIPCWLLPSEKDLTDLEMAVDKAMELGAGRILLCGCTGGREDHHLANLYLLESLQARGIPGMIINEYSEISVISAGTYQLENIPPYHYFSLLPAGEKLEGVTLRECKYPAERVTVPRGSTLTVSNEYKSGRPAFLTLESGKAYLIRSVPEG